MKIDERTRGDAAIACMAVASIRMGHAANWDGPRRPMTEVEEDELDARRYVSLAYGEALADVALAEIVGRRAAELAQRARSDYAVASSHASIFWRRYRPWNAPDAPPTPAEREEDAEDRARHDALIDGLRWAEAAGLLLDGWSPT